MPMAFGFRQCQTLRSITWRWRNDHEGLRKHHKLPHHPALLRHLLQRLPHIHLQHKQVVTRRSASPKMRSLDYPEIKTARQNF